MQDKNKNSSAFGPSSILATSILTLGGSLIGAVSYLSIQQLSIENDQGYGAIVSLESNLADPSAKLPEMPAEIKWVTYINETYGFSFQHPDNWRVTKDLFSEDFVLVMTNKTYGSTASGEIRIEALKEADLTIEKNPKDLSDDEDAVFSYETSFSHIVSLAGKDKKEFVRLQYMELDNSGAKVPKDSWQYFDIYKKITESFAFQE